MMGKLEFINDNGKLTIQKSNISGSKFHRVILDDCNFNDVSMKNCKIIDANLINLEIEDAQLGGAYFHNISGSPAHQSPPDPAFKAPSLRFENCDLKSARFSDCNLKDIEISNCNLTGMKINGILVEDLLKAYDN